MPEFSKLEWIIPRTFPEAQFEEDVYCLGDHKYVLKEKDSNHFMMITGYGENEKEEFIPEEHPEIILSSVKTYRIDEQIEVKDMMISKTLEYLESLPDFTLLILNELDETVFGKPVFVEPSTLHYPSFDLEYSMYSIYILELIEKANENGMYFPVLDDFFLENLAGYDKTKRQDLLRKNCLPEKKETEDTVELVKETFSGHKVRVVYSKKENKYKEILLEENPDPQRKQIPGFIENDEKDPSDKNYGERLHGELFVVAINNDLNGLKRAIDEGADINSHDDYYHDSVVALWLKGYYWRKEDDVQEGLYMYATTNGSFEYNNFPPDILCVPLNHRNDGLLEAIEWMVDKGLNLNDRYSDSHEINDTPLLLAVMNMDYYMTEYLLNQGADPYEWVFADPEEREEGEKEDAIGRMISRNLSSIDGDPVSSSIWLKFAGLLMEHGYEGEFFSFPNSLFIDPEKDQVYFTQTAFPKY